MQDLFYSACMLYRYKTNGNYTLFRNERERQN
jgi:hypothetical protein